MLDQWVKLVVKDTSCDLGSAYQALLLSSGGGVVGGKGEFLLGFFLSI